MAPRSGHAEREHELLAALTLLIANWGSTATQQAIAQRAGVVVDPADVQPLYVLGLSGPQRASALAEALRLSRPTMSKQLARLERAGLIERRPDAGDGRAFIVRLSPAGADAYQRLVREGLRIVHRALASVDAARTTAFAENLSRFVAALAVDGVEAVTHTDTHTDTDTDTDTTHDRHGHPGRAG